jgi:NTE family protein
MDSERSSPAHRVLDEDQRQAEAATRMDATGERALVLGGGGATGNAWSVGVVAGLLEAGIDVTNADLIVGTSAGATTAAQITSASPVELYADILAAAPERGTAPVRSDREGGRTGPAMSHLERTSRIIARAEDASDMRRRLGASALEMEATSDRSAQSAWRATVAARLPSQQWPDTPLLITAVDAHTGEPVVFDRHSGVDLADAVTASCSSGFAYGIGDQRYIDGGYRSNADNADLAVGCARVLVLSPFGGRSRTPAEWGMQLAAQVLELRARGSQVETVFPSSNIDDMFGANAIDVSLRPSAARAGYAQGIELVDQLAAIWC